MTTPIPTGGAATVLREDSAHKIYAKLGERVVGQEQAKRDLATLLAMHLAWFAQADLEHTAPNALLIGPTGVGKTHAIRTAAQFLHVPLVIVDGTRLSTESAQGMTLEEVLAELISAARKLIKEHKLEGDAEALGVSEYDELDLARRGIVFIDEFDKLSRRNRLTGERNELLQRRLLQFVDGTTVTLNPTPVGGEEEVQFDTAGLLFVVSGAFTGILEDVGERSQERMRDMTEYDYVIFEDIVRFGFMEELVARLPVIIEFGELSADNLTQILRNQSVDPSLFYIRYLRSLGVDLRITPAAQQYIGARAAPLRIGARGLHQVLFPLLALLSQQLQEDRPDEYELDLEDTKRLIRQVEERRRENNSD